VKHIFGPVPSRRLGRSLGIDIIPHKTCTFDCIYCECGATTNKTCERREFFPLSALLDELEDRLSEMPSKPEVITLSGAGEPSLYERAGELIREAKRLSRLPVAVITNSSLLDRIQVREELLEADIVLPSLDAADEPTFKRLNRPLAACNLESIIGGAKAFLERFTGTVLFEVLLLDGFNTGGSHLEQLRKTIRRFRVDRIQINTAVRPGTVRGIVPVAREELSRMASLFGPCAEVIADPPAMAAIREDRSVEDTVLSLLARRPCTAEDIGSSLGIPVLELTKMIDRLAEKGLVESDRHGGAVFYTATTREPNG
jgi:wyosine [tRNA(Phe)-imidazoG37] synthetase (radical SAM superfamily)